MNIKKLPNRQTGAGLLFLIIGMAVLFFALMSFSLRGWGYAGYGGFGYGPSFFYFGGPSYYSGRSVRTGSIGGPGNRSGGISGGGK
ncbi:MAG: hypothetical protein ACC707_01810 [Thiohalomonadales bacterium]